MPRITLEDFQLSSDDENHEDEQSKSMHDSIHESSEDEVAGNCADSDPYAQFSTDYKKFEYDESRWNGIPNVRKHNKEAERTKKAKTEEQGKLETQPKPVERKMRSKDDLVDQAIDIPVEGEIYFNDAGALWYSHVSDNIPISGESRDNLLPMEFC